MRAMWAGRAILGVGICLSAASASMGCKKDETSSGTPLTTSSRDLSITFPAEGAQVPTSKIVIKGTAPQNAQVRRDISFHTDDSIQADASGAWVYEVDLDKGDNSYEFFLE